MLKRVFSFIFLFVLVISTAMTGNVAKANESFTDLGSVSWAEDAIYYLNEQGIINGYGNGKFGPNDNITREQAALMLVRELYPNETSSTKLTFSDVDAGSIYYNAIAVAVDHGLFEGYPDGSFKPQDPITRAATAKIFALAYDLEGTGANFTDLNKAPWAIAYIKALASNNIVNGYEDNTFGPNSTITRAEFSLSFARILDDRFKPKSELPELTVRFLDVGQGDAILIQYPNGKTTLIDAGRYAASIDEALKAENVSRIDTFIATHPDADHIGGAAHVINNYGVTKVIDSGQEHTTQTYLDYLTTIDASGAQFEVAEIGDNVSDDSAVTGNVLFVDSNASDLNDGSIVIMLSYGLTDFLLTGDAGIEVEDYLIEGYDDLEAEILKVSHHGSNTGTSGDFIEAVSPIDAVLSYGNNSYGHPHDEVVSDLSSYGVNLYSTFEQGTIVVGTNGTNYSIEAHRVQWEEEPTPQPEPTPDPNPADAKVSIVNVDEGEEVVTIKNKGNTDVDMTGWNLVSVVGNQTYDFPSGYILKAGATVTITSGSDALYNPPTHLKWTGANIWNNSGDPAQLLNNEGVMVSEFR